MVNKRRTLIQLKEVYAFMNAENNNINFLQHDYMNMQILKEIKFLKQFYRLRPKMVLCYERQAYQGIVDKDLRITFDMNIRSRRHDLRLENGSSGEQLAGEIVLMEIKVARNVDWPMHNIQYWRDKSGSFSGETKATDESLSKSFRER